MAEAIPDQKYTGNYIRPALTIYDNGKLLVEGKDYQVVNGNNLRAGESWVVIKGLGNYDETKRVYFNIVASLEDAIIDSVPEQLYTGSPICPSIHVACGGNTLTLNEDYETTYANNELAGDASITVRPLTQYYTGTIVKKFKISNSISKATVTGIPASEQYTGQTYKPVPVVKMGSKVLTEDVDYTVSYSNNRNVGTARVIISGIGVYSGEKVVTFVIKEKSIENCTVLTVASLNYNGNLQTPPVVVKDGRKKLEENVDYKLSYRNNMAVGTAYVTITGIGDYKGAVTTTFEILYVKSPQTTPSQLSSVGIYLWQYENGMIEGGAVVNSEADTSQLLYRWLVYDVKNNQWIQASDWSSDYGIHYRPSCSGDYLVYCEVKDTRGNTVNTTVGVNYRHAIRAICQMPDPSGNGYLIGIQSFTNPGYSYEMQILDCNLYMQGKDAWIYSTGKCGTQGNTLWTTWQPKTGYYWTLFNIYDASGNLIDQQCYGFTNAE